MPSVPPVAPEVIHQRTRRGQMAVSTRATRLNPAAHQLLLMVNGHTPSAYLIELAGLDQAQGQQALAELSQLGFIELLS